VNQNDLKPASDTTLRYIQFVRDNDTATYTWSAYWDYPYLFVAYLLTDRSSSDDIIGWINDPKRSYYSEGITSLEKQTTGKIVLDFSNPCMNLSRKDKDAIKKTFALSEIKEEFIIAPHDLLYIMSEWEHVKKYNYPELYVKSNDTIFWLEGVI
jgi:hypothetical protein